MYASRKESVIPNWAMSRDTDPLDDGNDRTGGGKFEKTTAHTPLPEHLVPWSQALRSNLT